MNPDTRISNPRYISFRTWVIDYWFYLLLGGFAALAGWLMIYDMQWGPWAFSDSAAYISAARNMVAGNGLTIPTPEGGLTPLRLHQPLYPLVMSFFLLFDIHPFTSSTVLNVACFSLSVFLIGFGSYYFSRSKVYALIIVFLMTWCPFVIENFDGAMSEPLYLFLTFFNFIAILFYLDKQKKGLLVIAAIATGLSILTRFIGIVNLVSVVLILWMLSREKFTRRVWDSIIFTVIAAILPFVWQVFSSPSAGIGDRQIIFPENIFDRIHIFYQAIRDTFADWLPLNKAWQISDESRYFIVVLMGSFIFASICVALWLKFRNIQNRLDHFDRLFFGSVIMILTYLLIFFATFAFSNLPPDVNNRTMIPLFPFFAMVFYGIFFHFPRTHLEKTISAIVILIFFSFSFLVWYPVSRELLYDRHHNGLGYTSKYYQESTILKAARSLPMDIPWISNEPAFFLLYLDKFPYDLNGLIPELTQTNLTSFGSGDTELDQIFREEKAALLLHQPQFENELRKRINDRAVQQIETFTEGLDVFEDSFDGVILFYPDAN